MHIETLTEVRTVLGESPVWDVDADRLYWVDSLGRAIHRTTADGRELKSWATPANVGSICLRRGAGAVGALKTGLHFIDFADGACRLIANPEPDRPSNTFNDGKVDRRGRFWFGSMDIAESGPNGSLYRLDPDLGVTRVRAGVTVSNGPCWSPDDRTFYFSDSATGEIRAFDFDVETGSIANERSFVSLSRSHDGLVDGATVDAEGYLWSAHVYAGRIARYAPDGKLDREIILPTGAVTSVMFGGPGLDIIFATSMAKPLRAGIAAGGPTAGCLFAIHGLGIRGMPEPKFAG
jgi:sugar lactone lactonase YvrE